MSQINGGGGLANASFPVDDRQNNCLPVCFHGHFFAPHAMLVEGFYHN
jgi:hypothetical protein